MPPPIPPDPVGDPELARLIDAHGGALYGVGVAGVGDPTGVAWDARIALLGYIAARYVRRELFPPNELHWREWSAAHPARGAPPGSYKAARGILSLPACPQCGSRAVLVEEQHATLAYYPEYSDDAGSVHRGDSNARGARYLCRRCDHRFEGER